MPFTVAVTVTGLCCSPSVTNVIAANSRRTTLARHSLTAIIIITQRFIIANNSLINYCLKSLFYVQERFGSSGCLSH